MIIFIAGIVSFSLAFLVLPYWIRRAKNYGFVEKDVHKKNATAVGLGGLIIGLGFIGGLLFYIAYEVFYIKSNSSLVAIFSVMTSILIAIILGLVDDLLGWKIGLRKYQKITMTFLIALPIMVINAGVSEITLPFIGQVNVFFLYPLILVPLGISGAANGFNILAGYNGLESGMGILILLSQGLIVLKLGNNVVALMAFCMAASLLAFLYYNKFPAKIFPGDSMTYSVGALIAIVAILGNIEKFSIMLFIPYLIEGALKLRGNLQKESFAKLRSDGSFTEPYDKYYGLEHIAITIARKIKKKAYETDVVFILWTFQIIISILVLADFFIFRII